MKLEKKLLLVLFVLMCTTHSLWAQSTPNLNALDSRYNVSISSSYYRYTEPGDIPMYVHIWGNVFRPGLYELPTGTDLTKALSLAGGFSLTPREWFEERITTFELYSSRDDVLPGSLVYQDTWTDGKIQLAQNPVLHDGNFLIVDTYTKRKFNWRDAITIVGAVASVAIAVERLSSL